MSQAVSANQPFSRISRLGHKQNWGWSLLILTAVISFTFSLLFDSVRLQDWSPIWFTINVATLLEVVIAALAMRSLFLDRLLDQRPRPWLNLVLAGLLGSLKNVSVEVVARSFGLPGDPIWAFRIVGGFGLGVAIFLFAGLALGAHAEHRAILAELQAVQRALLQLRNSSKARLDAANDKLAQQARELLLPKLHSIQIMIANPADTPKAIASLREFIYQDVRPLSDSLAERLVVPAHLSSLDVDASPRRRFFKSEVEVKPLIPVWLSGVMFIFGAFAIAYMVLGAPDCNPAIIVSPWSMILLSLCKLALPAHFKLTRIKLGWFTIALGLLCSAPTYVAMYIQAANLGQQLLMAIYVPLMIFGLLAFVYSESLDSDRIHARDVVVSENQDLAHDQALFEQKLWLARRSWQFVVHGTVQSALTAALTRLQATEHPDAVVLATVNQDIERARTALVSKPDSQVNLFDALGVLQETWQGICQITPHISEQATAVIEADSDASACLNEIVKEAISNAVRHGDAQNIDIQIELCESSALQVLVTNDGLPLRNQNPQGVGSRLIEELTTDWSLATNHSTGLTEFRANLPLQRNLA
jgi:two-component sensor histidine kinase